MSVRPPGGWPDWAWDAFGLPKPDFDLGQRAKTEHRHFDLGHRQAKAGHGPASQPPKKKAEPGIGTGGKETHAGPAPHTKKDVKKPAAGEPTAKAKRHDAPPKKHDAPPSKKDELVAGDIITSRISLFNDKKTASGKSASTTVGFAHRTLPIGAKFLVSVNGGKEVLAEVIDRGPYVKAKGEYTRDFDISTAMAEKLGLPKTNGGFPTDGLSQNQKKGDVPTVKFKFRLVPPEEDTVTVSKK
jgi:hypothetical protein